MTVYDATEQAYQNGYDAGIKHANQQMTQKLLPAIMAAEFCLRKSKEVKCEGVFYSNVKDIENCIKIPFEEASKILAEFIETTIKENQ